ncbi:hypothetical protein AGR6A_Lc170095 [Agrobacterium sp. NCPPB 925]|nr:hypothetical protein AGR6A_Lc170095 [Agrobacterium sp. NCPPB 925]
MPEEGALAVAQQYKAGDAVEAPLVPSQAPSG